MSIRSEISNAYYDARNAGRTMESAADDAAKRVADLITRAMERAFEITCGYCHGDGHRGGLDCNRCGERGRIPVVPKRVFEDLVAEVTG